MPSIPSIRSIAIIDPMNDFGIGGYIYELAEGLEANGVSVDVYSSLGDMSKLAVSRHHRLYPVVGSTLYKQRKLLSGKLAPPRTNSIISNHFPWNLSLVRRLKDSLRTLLLPLELACYLKKKHYSLVWTQWPRTKDYGTRFWS